MQSISLSDSKRRDAGTGLYIGVRVLNLLAGVCADTMPIFARGAFTERVKTSKIFAGRIRYTINDFAQEDLYAERPYATAVPLMRYYAEVPLKSAATYVIET